MQLNISPENSNQRLDKFLVNKLENLSRSQIQKKIKNTLILVNNKNINPHYFLKAGDVITVTSKQPTVISNKKLLNKIKIIFEDKNYLIIYKPAGLLIHPDNIHNETTLQDYLEKKFKKIYITHRLDRDVCGLLVVAKNLDSYNYFKNLFKTRKIIKIYQALVHGKVETDQGIIYRPIIRSKKTGLMIAKSTPDSKAKKAITEFKVLERYKNYSLLKINLKTGRTHQIRVHLKSIGHSIVGDKLYKTKNLKNKINNKINLNNIFLCAVELEFLDINNNLQHYKINLPRNLKIFLNNLQSSRRRE